MNSLMKKRVKAYLIDAVISTGASLAAEKLLRKKGENGFFYTVVAPSAVLWGLEYAQLRFNGQTIGQKLQGIRIANESGQALSSQQILKRVIHRDSISPLEYLRNRSKYDAYEGGKFPHDFYANTVVKES